MKIGIAGAGIAGLATAAFLARDGHEALVFDQFDRPKPIGSGLVVQPVGMAVLRALGTLPDALDMGAKINRMLGHEAEHGRTVLDVSYGASGSGRFGLALHRSVLFDATYKAAIAAGVTLVPSHRVTGCDAAAGQFIFENTSRSDQFDLLVDAAGAASPLSPLVADTLPFGALWGTVAWPDKTVLPYDQLSQMYRRADHMLGVMPIGRLPDKPGRHATIFWSLPADSFDDWRRQPLQDWIDQATRIWPEFEPFIGQITDHTQMTVARYSHATLRRPWRDGLVHIGDAAHRASPQLGQGANMALLDAFALAAALRQAQGTQALARFARLRRWHLRLYQGMSYAFTPQYQSNSRWLPVLRDRVLAPASRIPPLPYILSKLVCGDLIEPFAGFAQSCDTNNNSLGPSDLPKWGAP